MRFWVEKLPPGSVDEAEPPDLLTVVLVADIPLDFLFREVLEPSTALALD